MLFIDGENLTIRGQKVLSDNGLILPEGPSYRKDCFLWLPVGSVTAPCFQAANRLQDAALRAYYYTSLVGDENVIGTLRQQIRDKGFSPEVFKRDTEQRKAKGVDIALTKDMLSHAFRDNYEIAVLVAGDGDYVPLVEEVKRLGKLVYLWFFAEAGLNPKLRLASDHFVDATSTFVETWRNSIRTN